MTGLTIPRHSIEDEAEANAKRVGQLELDRLRALGCDAAAAIADKYIPFGVAYVEKISERTFQPAPEGTGRLMLTVNVASPDTAYRPARWRMFDMIAFHTSQPDAWLWRTDVAWALNEHCLTDWNCDDEITIVANPLEWLQRGCRDVCILDWSKRSPAWDALRMVPQASVTSDRLRQRILDTIARTAPRPELTVLKKGVQRAA